MSENDTHDVKLSDIQSDTKGMLTLFNDIFGLNADGFRTIFTLFKDPAPYFQAAKRKDWSGFYRPSIRVYFSIILLTAGMRFLWESETSPMITLYSDLMQQIADGVQEGVKAKGEEIDFSDFDPVHSAQTLFRYYLIVLPLIYMGALSLLAVIYRFWDERLNYVVRLRYLFAILIPGTFLGLISSLSAAFVQGPIFQNLTFVFLLLMLGMYFMTAYRGAYANSTGSRFWRSMTITLIMFVLVMICTMVALVVSLIPTIKTTFPI